MGFLSVPYGIQGEEYGVHYHHVRLAAPQTLPFLICRPSPLPNMTYTLMCTNVGSTEHTSGSHKRHPEPGILQDFRW